MFGQTYSAKLTFDATTGLPSGVTEAKKEDLIAGVLKGITSHASKDVVVVGLGRTLAATAVAYGSANFAAKQKTGAFQMNPWSAA